MTGFPTRAAIELEERPREQQWLVDTLWGEQAVGIVGGEPKCGKSLLALDLAVAVAAGVPCLRHFATARPGPVLLFAAEDAGHLVRKRLQGIARSAGACFETLDIAVINVPTLRLDHLDDRRRLQETVERIGPRFVILNPLVRLHGVDENTVADVAPSLMPWPASFDPVIFIELRPKPQRGIEGIIERHFLSVRQHNLQAVSIEVRRVEIISVEAASVFACIRDFSGLSESVSVFGGVADDLQMGEIRASTFHVVLKVPQFGERKVCSRHLKHVLA